jgi:adenylate cyclase
MGTDEEGTLAQLKAHRRALVDPKIEEHRGRIVKTTGDGMLTEFASVVDALRCAIEIQRGMLGRNAELPHEQRIELRVGINVGDIIIDGDDIYGDGVNVAARLESLAEPGGICVSARVQEDTRGKIDIVFEDAGEQQLKNIAHPVRVYRVRFGSEAAMARPALALPDKPSIAVLPFANMSGDPTQEYISDGISDDIITELSRFREFFVIARNSSFQYRDQHVDVRRVGRELGVRYVVEGSVRTAGKRLRITAQLVDSETGSHLWAQRYDRDLDDIFSVQDEVTKAVVMAIEPELASAERQRARRKPAESLGAWECYQRGLWHAYRYDAENNAKADAFFRRAINLDPNFSSAYAGQAYAIYYGVILGLFPDPKDQIARALGIAKTAVSLDPNDAFAHVALGRVYLLVGEHESSLAELEDALALTPNYAGAHFGRAHTLWMAGRPEEAIASHDEAMRLSPRDPLTWAFMASKAIALSLLDRHEEAVDWARRSQRQPNAAIWSIMVEISALAHLDRTDEAKQALARAVAIKPDISLAFVDTALNFKYERDRQHYIDGFVKVGLRK